jgi:hypothetical protein
VVAARPAQRAKSQVPSSSENGPSTSCMRDPLTRHVVVARGEGVAHAHVGQAQPGGDAVGVLLQQLGAFAPGQELG